MFGLKRNRTSAMSFSVGAVPKNTRLNQVYARPEDEEAAFSLENGDHCIAPKGAEFSRSDPASDLTLIWVECGEKGKGWVLDGILDYSTVNR